MAFNTSIGAIERLYYNRSVLLEKNKHDSEVTVEQPQEKSSKSESDSLDDLDSPTISTESDSE